jgi:hypothetical protein
MRQAQAPTAAEPQRARARSFSPPKIGNPRLQMMLPPGGAGVAALGASTSSAALVQMAARRAVTPRKDTDSGATPVEEENKVQRWTSHSGQPSVHYGMSGSSSELGLERLAVSAASTAPGSTPAPSRPLATPMPGFGQGCVAGVPEPCKGAGSLAERYMVSTTSSGAGSVVMPPATPTSVISGLGASLRGPASAPVPPPTVEMRQQLFQQQQQADRAQTLLLGKAEAACTELRQRLEAVRDLPANLMAIQQKELQQHQRHVHSVVTAPHPTAPAVLPAPSPPRSTQTLALPHILGSATIASIGGALGGPASTSGSNSDRVGSASCAGAGRAVKSSPRNGAPPVVSSLALPPRSQV